MPRYSQKFKAEAIGLGLKSHRSHQEIAFDLGISPSTFHKWMSQTKVNFILDTNNISTEKNSIDLVAELQAVKRELKYKQKEVDILKKAAVYFAQNQK